ncbi:MAG: hypothetical protein JSV82_03960 [Planctomycetota bacterium]|nr:MAG: hypothetical protein JSV82_03960 [Planctomycetota bacterium]
MFYMILIVIAIIVAIGWIAYGIWSYRVYREEKNKPRPKSERLVQSRKSFEEYMERMKEFEEKRALERKGKENKNVKGE